MCVFFFLLNCVILHKTFALEIKHMKEMQRPSGDGDSLATAMSVAPHTEVSFHIHSLVFSPFTHTHMHIDEECVCVCVCVTTGPGTDATVACLIRR